MDIVLNYMIQHLNYIAYCASHDVLAPKVFNPNSTSYTLFKKLIKIVFKALDWHFIALSNALNSSYSSYKCSNWVSLIYLQTFSTYSTTFIVFLDNKNSFMLTIFESQGAT